MSNYNNKLQLNNTDLQDILDTINNLPEADTDTSDATATSADILSGKTAYVDGSKITGTIEEISISSPVIDINSSGLITASVAHEKGYVSMADVQENTKQLTTQSAKTITPSVSSQTAVSSGVYTTGAVTVEGDANLVSENIASGKSIFGVVGSHEGGTDTSDATATADEIFAGETAYTADGKVTGIFTIENEITTQEELIAELNAILDNKAAGSGIGDIDTCTVRFSGITPSNIAATIYSNGEITTFYNAQNITTISNVLCNSVICFSTGLYYSVSYRNATLLYAISGNYCVGCTASKNEEVEIIIRGSGGSDD